jgi:cytochrome c553
MADRSFVPFSALMCVCSVALALGVGCAADVSAPVAYSEPSEADSGAPPLQEQLAPGTWEAMDFGERTRFMSEVVMPTMRSLFVESDAERFASFSCASCHGQGARDGTFAMPSADLPALGGAPANADETHMQLTDFMRNTVKPKMAELLGQPELRCGKCHPSAS